MRAPEDVSHGRGPELEGGPRPAILLVGFRGSRRGALTRLVAQRRFTPTCVDRHALLSTDLSSLGVHTCVFDADSTGTELLSSTRRRLPYASFIVLARCQRDALRIERELDELDPRRIAPTKIFREDDLVAVADEIEQLVEERASWPGSPVIRVSEMVPTSSASRASIVPELEPGAYVEVGVLVFRGDRQVIGETPATRAMLRELGVPSFGSMDELLEGILGHSAARTVAKELAHGPLHVDLRTRDGRTLSLHASVVADVGGRPSAFTVVLQDLSRAVRSTEAARRRERRLGAVLRSISDGVVGIDASGHVVFANHAAGRMLGRTHSEMMGHDVHELLHGRSASPAGSASRGCAPETCPIEHWREAGPAAERVRCVDDELVRRDGSWFPAALTWTAIEGGEGSDAYGSVAVLRDTTKEREEQRQRELFAAALQRANAELDSFAYVASHDLKAPLRGIAQLATWIDDESSSFMPESSREHLRRLQQRVARLGALVDGILAYSRAGKVEVGEDLVDAGHVVREVIDMLVPAPPAAVIVTTPLPVVAGPRAPLAQVFLNLVGNALKHAGRSDVRVEVSARDCGRFVEFSVRDDGRGIRREHAEAVWELFRKLESQDSVEGSGIGLAVVKRVVEQAGGRATLETTPDGGATFRFTWPAVEA